MAQRLAHVQVPDFSAYRRQNSGVEEGDFSRRAFTYVLTGGVGVVAAHTAKNMVQDFLDTMSTSVLICARGVERRARINDRERERV